jgi:hypothetical protein
MELMFPGENAGSAGWHGDCIQRGQVVEQTPGVKTILEKEQPMNQTILNYPGFQSLPKGVKQMLLVSEAHFFNQPARRPKWRHISMQAVSVRQGFKAFNSILAGPAAAQAA